MPATADSPALLAGTMQTISGQLILSSHIDAVVRARVELIPKLRRLGYSQSEMFGTQLALEETVTNSVQHGNRNDPQKRITINFVLSPQELWIEVIDEGAGFDLSTVPDPTTPDRLQVPSGRGIFLVRAFMNEVTYQDGGRRVELRKSRGNTSSI